MFSHVFTSVTDFEKGLDFYEAVMQSLDLELRFCDRDRPWAGWHCAGGERPLFVICKPDNGLEHVAGNGQMIAFLAKSRAQVDQTYDVALRHGGKCEGPPGLRAHYHPDYYGAYFRDPDGNKIAVACHQA